MAVYEPGIVVINVYGQLRVQTICINQMSRWEQMRMDARQRYFDRAYDIHIADKALRLAEGK